MMRELFARLLYPLALIVETLRHRESPWKLRAQVLVALAYVVLPWDFIPDLLPVVGLSDDVTALAILLFSLARNLPRPITEAARARARRWAKLSP